MNVTPCDPQTPLSRSVVHGDTAHTPTSSFFQPPFTNTTPRLNSISSATTVTGDLNRVYENMDTAEIRPLLSRALRFSKPDLFGKPLEPPATPPNVAAAADKSEPSTPTIHYIVLDLDHTSNSSGSNPAAATTSPTTLVPSLTGGGAPAITTTPIKTTPVAPLSTAQLSASPSLPSIGTLSTSSTTAPLSPLPPESPKKGIMDYAKIDFDRTVALSSTVNRSSDLDSEESRKTRHSSVAKTPTIAAE